MQLELHFFFQDGEVTSQNLQPRQAENGGWQQKDMIFYLCLN